MTGVGIHHTAGRVVARPFRNDEDYWLVRNLLIETYPITPTAFNWDIRRWDGARSALPSREPSARWAYGQGNWSRPVSPWSPWAI
jgi:hypothetical protein